MPVLNLARAEPAMCGLRELYDVAAVRPAASLRAPAESGPLACWVPGTVQVGPTHTDRRVKSRIFHVACPGGGVK
jgi:hypothetical protein